MFTDTKNNKLKEGSFSESPENKGMKTSETAKEVKEASVGKEAYREAVGFDESNETTGKVSEILQEQGEQSGGSLSGTGSSTVKSYDPAQIRANLLKNIPSEKVMKRQIESEVKKEIDYLHKKAMKLFALPSGMSFFEMSNLMKKIRELKGVLLMLAKASLDALKTLWLRFVHGVM